jgi:hypothetical protein
VLPLLGGPALLPVLEFLLELQLVVQVLLLLLLLLLVLVVILVRLSDVGWVGVGLGLGEGGGCGSRLVVKVGSCLGQRQLRGLIDYYRVLRM